MIISNVLVFINLAVAAAAVAMILLALPLRRYLSVKYLLLFNFSFLFLCFCTVSVLIIQDFELKVLYSRLRFVGLSLMAPAYVLTLTGLSGRLPWLQKKGAQVLLFLPSLITITLTLVPSTRDLVVHSFEIFNFSDVSVLSFKSGPWLAGHLIFSYVSLAILATLLVYLNIVEKGRRRKQAFLLMATLMLTISFDFYCVATGNPLRWAMMPTSLFGLNQFALLYCCFTVGLVSLTSLAKQRIFDLIPDPILVVDHQKNLVTANLAALRKFSIEAKQISLPLAEVLPEFSFSEREFKFTVPSGVHKVYAIENRSLDEDEQLTIGSLILFRDITEQKMIAAKLEKIIQFDADLLAFIGHDLSGNIHLQRHLVRDIVPALDGEDKELGGILERSTVAASELIDSMIAWSRTHSPEGYLAHKEFDLNLLVKDCCQSISAILNSKSIQLSIILPGTPLMMKGDSIMIASVIRNIVNNAIRASRVGGAIEVSLNQATSEIEIRVKDGGAGMTADKVESIMGENYANQGKGGGEGYGIGLKMTKRFIKHHQGRLHVQSELGKGTEVTVALPFAQA